MLLFLEKVLLLSAFLILRTCHKDLFARIWVDSRIEHHRGEGHWCWGQILYLLKGEVEFTEHLYRESAHICFATTRVRGDKVWDELISQSILAADAVKVTV